MENDGCNAKCQLPLPFKCKKIVADAGKEDDSNISKVQETKIDDEKKDVADFALETPIKKPAPPRSKITDDAPSVKEETQNSDDSKNTACSLNELPEKYSIISKFFDEMGCSVRLLNLLKKPSTFRNISAQLEVLTRRKFLYRHLAQIIYIYPEAICVEKILTHDVRTSRMVPDMKITILYCAIETCDGVPSFTSLQEAFRTRLFNFVNSNEVAIDIPEAALPWPFNYQSPSRSQMPLSAGISISPIKSRPLRSGEEEDASCISRGTHSCKSTPIKPVDTSTKLMVMTPDLQMPKISKAISPLEEADSPVKISVSSVKKSLNFFPATTPVDSLSPSEHRKSVCHPNHQVAEDRSIVEQDLKLSFTATKEIGESGACGTLEHQNTQKTSNEKKELLAGLLDLSNAIECIFQSRSKSYSITKQELVHKILVHGFGFEDAEEVEEKLKLLENLVPDWINGKTGFTGDLMYSRQKAYDLEAIRARLIEAI